MAWINRHLVNLLFGLALLILVLAIFLSPNGPRGVAMTAAFVLVFAAVIIRARRRPRPLPPPPPAPPTDPA